MNSIYFSFSDNYSKTNWLISYSKNKFYLKHKAYALSCNETVIVVLKRNKVEEKRECNLDRLNTSTRYMKEREKQQQPNY